MALLQAYPIRDAGGVDRVLQLAYDLAKQRETQVQATAARSTGGFGARWRNTVWKLPVPAPAPVAEVKEEHEDSESTSESESEDEEQEKPLPDVHVDAPRPSTLGSRLAETVWKGITNQSAMEPPPSPMSPGFSPQQSPQQASAPLPSIPEPAAHEEAVPETPPPASSNRGSGIWGYAEKLRDSDAAATLAKVSTNWRVKAIDAWSKRSSVVPPQSAPASSSTLSPAWIPSSTNRGSLQVRASPRVYDPKRSSLPEADRSDVYSPPARPAYFHPPRDSMLPDRRDVVPSPTGSDMSARSGGSFDSLKGRRESMGIPSPGSTTRSGGPRPLLLNSASLITHSRSPTSVMDAQFSDAVRAKRPSSTHRSSQSSVSSMSPSEHSSARRSHMIDVIPSRVVPLNRKTPSPMARTRRQESLSSMSSPSGSVRRLPADTSPESDGNPTREKHGWRSADAPPATTSTSSPPLPGTPPSAAANSAVRVVTPEPQRGSVVLSEFGEVETSIADTTPKVRRKSNASLSRLQIDDSSDSSAAPQQVPARMARVRSRRQHPPRLASLRTRENSKSSVVVDRAPSPNTLAAPEWPEDSDATTPKAASFEGVSTSPVPPRRARKLSGEGRTRKVSTDGSTHSRRKVSSERREVKHKRDSSAVEGDDEGYDDLLSAYESEDSAALD